MVRTHLFICTNTKANGDSCAPKGSEQLRANLKAQCSKVYDKTAVRINTSGCLGQCENGIAAVLYPKGEWFTKLDASTPEALSRSEKLLLDAVFNDQKSK